MEFYQWVILGWCVIAVIVAIGFCWAVRGMRHDEPRPALLPTLWSALRGRADRVARRWRPGDLRRVR